MQQEKEVHLKCWDEQSHCRGVHGNKGSWCSHVYMGANNNGS